MNVFLGMSVAFGLMALLPSKTEDKWPVPWASIALAIVSGACAGAATLPH